MSYNVTKTNVVQLQDAEKGVLHFIPKNKKPVKLKELTELNKKLTNKYKDNDFKHYVRIKTKVGWFTAKSFNDDDFDQDDFEKYLEGRINNISNFTDIYNIQIGYIKNI